LLAGERNPEIITVGWDDEPIELLVHTALTIVDEQP
jgi:hypothetical protein